MLSMADLVFSDFLALSANFGAKDANREQGDFNADGIVDFTDFLLLSEYFGGADPVEPV